MKKPDTRAWMWSNALDTLARADRLHRQLFQPISVRSRKPGWEPPVDMVETEREVVVLAALPGVDPKDIEVAIDGGLLIIAGDRLLPPQFKSAAIHRLELPQGRFERAVPLPPGRYEIMRPSMVNGCLSIVLRKLL